MTTLTGLSPWDAILVEALAMTGLALSHFITFVELVSMGHPLGPSLTMRIGFVTGIARRRFVIGATPQIGVAEVTGTLHTRFSGKVGLTVFRIKRSIGIGKAVRVPICNYRMWVVHVRRNIFVMTAGTTHHLGIAPLIVLAMTRRTGAAVLRETARLLGQKMIRMGT